MGKWIMQDTGREFVVIEIVYKGATVGWIGPDDYLAYLDGDLDETGLLHIARLTPDQPKGTIRLPAGVARYVEDNDDA